jgi:hypothetical protein
MSDASRVTANDAAKTPVQHQAPEAGVQTDAGVGNLAVASAARHGNGAAFPGAPLGNLQLQRAHRRCPSCELAARRYGVQAKCAACVGDAKASGGGSVESVRSTLAAASQPLPHFQRIQAAFGQHDLSAVRTISGDPARSANEQIGARAFTSGHRIAFRDTPDERLAAHESAHVIQQREAKSAPGGSGDAWERHADDVADAVVDGRSAEPLLDKVAGGDGSRSPTIQLQPAPDKGKPDSDDEPATMVWGITFNDVYLTDSPAQVRTALEAWAAKQSAPHDALRTLARDFATQQGVHSDIDSVASTGNVGRYCRPPDVKFARAESDPSKRIPKLVTEVALQIINDDDEFLIAFEARAKAIVNGMLDESETRVTSELERYGVRDVHLAGLFRIDANIDDDKTSRGMGVAAEGMIARKQRLDTAKRAADQKALERDAQISYYADPTPIAHDPFGNPNYIDGNSRPLPSYAVRAIGESLPPPAGYEAAQTEYTNAKRDYDVYKQQIQQMYPILASWTDDYDGSALDQISKLKKGKNNDATSLIVEELGSKLVNIGKVREGLQPGGDVNLWRVPKIINGTRAQLAIVKGSLHEKILDEKHDDEQPSTLTQILVGLLQFALVLLAPVTEGVSLIGAAAIGVGQAYEQFKEFELKTELHNTDFGAAALSAEEPSLFWLGAAIVGAGFDVYAAGGAALKIFRALAPVAKTIRAGVTAEQAAQDLANLERAAVEVGGDSLAKSVGQHAKDVQSSKSVGMTATETAELEEVGAQAASEELASGAEGAKNIAGGETKVSASGDLWSCRSPCVMVRERYAKLLDSNRDYLLRVEALETRARALGAADEAGRKAIAEEAATLEREMRTTSPADWTPPLKNSADYDKQVARRGSALPELDGHPPGWSGWDEARFRYGRAVDDIPEGYTFELRENGELAVRRLEGATNKPPLRFNAATGEFETVEENVLRATKDPMSRQTKAFSDLGKQTQSEINQLLAQRKQLIAQRDALEALQAQRKLTEAESEQLSKLYGRITDRSRLMGEAAADEMYKSAERVYPKSPKPSTSGDFDRVYKVGDEYHVVEAKGGAGQLGTRNIGGAVAEQGTPQYLEDIIRNMRKNPATRQLADELAEAQRAGKLKYVLVRAPIGTDAGQATVKTIDSVEFELGTGG